MRLDPIFLLSDTAAYAGQQNPGAARSAFVLQTPL